MITGKLYIVGTPIGNLQDLSSRAIETFQSVDVILCEDTRVSRKLMQRFDIETPLMSYHQHSDIKKYEEIEERLRQGENIALISDAGTPAISDPGGHLVEYLAHDPEDAVTVLAIPGPSAIVSALSISGFPADKFTFLGFPPQKKKRKQFFEEVEASRLTVAFYESPYRIQKALDSLEELLDEDRQVCVCREITKMHESRYRGTMAELQAMEIPARGEFVVVVRALKGKK